MLNGKTVLITGASRGIGKAIALKMAENGANVAIVYSSNENAAIETLQEIKKLGVDADKFSCNVSDFEKTGVLVKEVIKRFGGIDILVNNAGITKDGLVITMKEADFDNVINTNLKGAFNMIKHTYSHFIKKRSGKIINIASVSGMMGNAGQANYSSAKAGMIGLTKSVAKEIAARGINCNAIAPGFIATDMTEKLPDNVKETAMNTIPLKRMGSTEDVANLAVFLASDNAGYITGEVIKVDGGLYI